MYGVLHLTHPGMQRESKMCPMVAEDISPRQFRMFFPHPQQVIAPWSRSTRNHPRHMDQTHTGFPSERKNSTDTQGGVVLARVGGASTHTAGWPNLMCAASAGLSLALCRHSLLDKADDLHKNSATNAG